MTIADITSHTWTRHKQAVDKIGKALHLLDFELRAYARDPQLQPGDRDRMNREARAKADASVRQARAALEQALNDDQNAGRYADVPAGEELARRSYYQGQARLDMEGRRADEAVAIVRQVMDSGDVERAREYCRAARSVVGAAAPFAAELRAVELDAMAPEEKAHRIFAAGVEVVQGNLSWLDRWTEQLSAQAGLMSERQRLGWEPEPEPLDTSILWKWQERVEQEAGVAGERQSAMLNRREPAEWARPRERETPDAEQGAVAGGADAGGAAS